MWFPWSDTCGMEPSKPTTHRMQQVGGFQFLPRRPPSQCVLRKSKPLFTTCVYPVPEQSRRVIQSTSHSQFRYGSSARLVAGNNAHPQHQLLLLLNRDEFHSRPTKAVGWWGEGPTKILGGKDVLGGGTWMGSTKDGRLAFLTNVLEPDAMPGARTRGDLPLRFLQGNKSPLEVATEVANEADEYNGFNLILADLTTNVMVYVSNRPKGQPATIQLVSPGLHVLSNARLDSPWHKAIRLGKNFRELLRKHGDDEVVAKDIAERLMTDTTRADKDMLPNTGCDPDWEHGLSSIFIEVQTDEGLYGTRSTAVLSVNYDGEASLYEKYLESGIWKDHTVHYQIE